MDSAWYVMIESNARLEPKKIVKGLLITLCAPVDTADTVSSKQAHFKKTFENEIKAHI